MILTSEYQCTECYEEQRFFGRRAEERQCSICGSYSLEPTQNNVLLNKWKNIELPLQTKTLDI